MDYGLDGEGGIGKSRVIGAFGTRAPLRASGVIGGEYQAREQSRGREEAIEAR